MRIRIVCIAEHGRAHPLRASRCGFARAHRAAGTPMPLVCDPRPCTHAWTQRPAGASPRRLCRTHAWFHGVSSWMRVRYTMSRVAGDSHILRTDWGAFASMEPAGGWERSRGAQQRTLPSMRISVIAGWDGPRHAMGLVARCRPRRAGDARSAEALASRRHGLCGRDGSLEWMSASARVRWRAGDAGAPAAMRMRSSACACERAPTITDLRRMRMRIVLGRS